MGVWKSAQNVWSARAPSTRAYYMAACGQLGLNKELSHIGNRHFVGCQACTKELFYHGAFSFSHSTCLLFCRKRSHWAGSVYFDSAPFSPSHQLEFPPHPAIFSSFYLPAIFTGDIFLMFNQQKNILEYLLQPLYLFFIAKGLHFFSTCVNNAKELNYSLHCWVLSVTLLFFGSRLEFSEPSHSNKTINQSRCRTNATPNNNI